MSELKPCPFCGSDHIKPVGYTRGSAAVTCYSCYAETRSIAAWNRRAALASSDAQADGASEAVAWLYEHAGLANRYVSLCPPEDPEEVADAGYIVTPLYAAIEQAAKEKA